MSDIKASIIITAHNYGKYVREAINSALAQNFNEPYEIVIVNDGSTDNTKDILATFESTDCIKVIELPGVGLASACNAGINASCGEYIIRLDADDWFDENILLVQSNILERRPDIGMVYPDYYQVDKFGNIIDHVRLQKIHDEVKLLDRSALAAGALYRRSCYDAVGGYNEDLRYQEDYDFWLRFTEKYNVYNVNLPLMYYRKHDQSMSTNWIPRMQARRQIKSNFAQSKERPEVLAVIPAKASDWNGGDNLALTSLAGKNVIDYSIEQALQTQGISRLIVSTDSAEIADYAQDKGVEVPFLRPKRLTQPNIPLREVLKDILRHLKDHEGYVPDYVMLLQIISPLRKSCHIQEAINTILIHNTDSVISVMHDASSHWRPGKEGLEPVIWKKRLLRKTAIRSTGKMGPFTCIKPTLS